jgi:hypothetical protein
MVLFRHCCCRDHLLILLDDLSVVLAVSRSSLGIAHLYMYRKRIYDEETTMSQCGECIWLGKNCQCCAMAELSSSGHGKGKFSYTLPWKIKLRLAPRS